VSSELVRDLDVGYGPDMHRYRPIVTSFRSAILVIATHALTTGCERSAPVLEGLGGPVAFRETRPAPTHGFLGIQWDPDAPLTVGRVARGTSAGTQGIAPGDRVRAIDGRVLTSTAEVQELLATKEPGDIVPLDVLRGSEVLTFKVGLTTYADMSRGLAPA